MRRWICLLLVAGGLPGLTGNHRPEAAPSSQAKAQGRTLTHEETLGWVAEHHAWQRARKTRPIWVRPLLPAEVGRAFQTADHVAEVARQGAWLCVGIAGEPWFQSREKIEGKYEAAGAETRRFAFDDQPRSYRLMKPKEGVRNWAAQVKGPGIAGFSIHPGYDPSQTLHAPAGGYVVRDDCPDPYRAPASDVWLVQQGLFESTYEVIGQPAVNSPAPARR
jgi:hypothetical protein